MNVGVRLEPEEIPRPPIYRNEMRSAGRALEPCNLGVEVASRANRRTGGMPDERLTRSAMRGACGLASGNLDLGVRVTGVRDRDAYTRSNGISLG
jgi:hypothetical protein